MFYESIIIHYDEIILKGGNRPFFERALENNVKEFLKGLGYESIRKEDGKIIVKIGAKINLEKTGDILKNIPGISNFYFAVSEKKDLRKINKKTVEILGEYLKTVNKKTFKIEARRSDKKFKFKSPEINSKVGEYILENTKLKVNVHNPDIEIIVDIGSKNCYIYFEKTDGIGGLPVGTSGKLISLISGGIDSPVASFMMNKRGAKNIFVHFKNKTIFGSADGSGKIEKLVRQLSKFQGMSKLYIIPFEEFQKEIISKVPAKNRMIIYRRIMFQISEEIAKKEKAKGLVTGDSLSQVASQTIDNIGVIYEAVKIPIFPPLIGMNKQEIVELARQIKTYEISLLTYQDCCSFLISRHPQTKAVLKEIIAQEKNLRIELLIRKTVHSARPKII